MRQVHANYPQVHNLYPKQANHPDNHVITTVYDGRQQLAVKAAEMVEELTLDWVRVDLQRLALQGQHEDAPAL